MAAATALLLVLLAPAAAHAQQVMELRGEVREQSINRQLIGSTAMEDQAEADSAGPAPYELFTQSAIEDPLAEEDPASADAIFGDADPALPATRSARPSEPSEPARPRAGAVPGADQAEPAATNLAEGEIAEQELLTGTVPADPADPLSDGVSARTGAASSRVGAIGGIDRPEDEDDPYAPLGIRTGTFLLFPTLEQGIGWTSNASDSPDGGDAVFSETALSLQAVSDWSRHSATIEADGSYRRSLSGEEISDPEGGVLGTLRLDLGSDFAASASAGYRLRPESASSPYAVEDATSSPLRHTLLGGAEIAKDVGKLGFALRGDVVRDVYGDADLAGGETLSQSDRNSTLATVTLRTGYELSPALRPFVEGEFGRRFFDERVDSAGYERSALRYGARAGLELDLSEKFRGEIAAGWLWERPEDDRLDDVSAPYVAGSLIWSPRRLTEVEFSGSTTVETATAAGETGSVLYTGAVTVRRELRHNLTGTALAGLDWRDYVGSGGNELLLRGELGLTWWMNRNAGITGRLAHERLTSDFEDRDYDASTVYLGLTLQR